MIAVIKTGGKQYLVRPGTKLVVEKIERPVNETVELPVLLKVADETQPEPSVEIGTPELAATLSATVMSQGRTKKIPVVKYKRKVHYRRNRSHRQLQTTLQIA